MNYKATFASKGAVSNTCELWKDFKS